MRQQQRQRGLTLIELMATIAIIAVLASIAYPVYQSQSRKGKRSDGIVAAEMVAQAERAYFGDNRFTYTTTVTDLKGFTSATSPGGYYDIVVTPGATGIASSYVITITAKGDQANDACTEYILYSSGQRDGTPSREVCWGK